MQPFSILPVIVFILIWILELKLSRRLKTEWNCHLTGTNVARHKKEINFWNKRLFLYWKILFLSSIILASSNNHFLTLFIYKKWGDVSKHLWKYRIKFSDTWCYDVTSYFVDSILLLNEERCYLDYHLLRWCYFLLLWFLFHNFFYIFWQIVLLFIISVYLWLWIFIYGLLMITFKSICSFQRFVFKIQNAKYKSNDDDFEI